MSYLGTALAIWRGCSGAKAQEKERPCEQSELRELREVTPRPQAPAETDPGGERIGTDDAVAWLAARATAFASSHRLARPEAERRAYRELIAHLDDPDRVPLPDLARPSATPWRQALATWQPKRREAWGQRANELEASGTTWLEAERVAFDETNVAEEVPR